MGKIDFVMVYIYLWMCVCLEFRSNIFHYVQIVGARSPPSVDVAAAGVCVCERVVNWTFLDLMAAAAAAIVVNGLGTNVCL